ncbi:hypothetical protein BWQ96_06082 [Gracilariopsis chorda]|uniref:Uncharacterized protein n=1 Tax=Gracilariopsis chorda TaxID=448386 RepID=A0A2V3IPZ0_9FLOR|nr:hypothetical protein BWQ96_06082 [Gracilariopsis chorda]|eukprot:PXF44155.1 hypothetical protein BWQ96_06082 [Gracilariopsis chorda]
MVHFDDHKVVMKLIIDYKMAESGSGFPLTIDREVEHSDPSFSLNEIARLIETLRDDERAKNALDKAIGRTLNRRELDANVTWDSYWFVIENRFNDKKVDSKHSFAGRLHEVDSNLRRLCDRSASVLKKQYNSMKKMVTITRANWSTSG